MDQEVKSPMKQDAFQSCFRAPEMPDGDDVILSFITSEGPQTIRTCPGDIYKIVNALMDYANILERAVEQWGLQGYHQALYQLHAEKCREIALKYSKGIGYDYQTALERCAKKQSRSKRDEGVGEDALVLAVRKREDPETAASTSGKAKNHKKSDPSR